MGTLRNRTTIPVSIPVARTDHGRQMGGQNLALPSRLAGNAANDSGMRERPVASKDMRSNVIRRAGNRIQQPVKERVTPPSYSTGGAIFIRGQSQQGQPTKVMLRACLKEHSALVA